MENQQGPKVIPVKDPEEEPDRSGLPPIHPHLPQISGHGGGALILMISPVKTGKSTIISNLLLNKDFYDAQERFDTTTIISNTIANCVTSRFLKDAFDVYDYYDDNIIDGIIRKQKEYKKKEEQPQICIVCDDCLGSIKREAKLNHLSSRFRHYNIKLLVLSSQKFTGAVSPVIRANATNVIVGSPFPNQRELGRIGDEYGDLFGGADQWMALYRAATPERYDFIHMSIQDNPPIMYKNFDEIVAIGSEAKIPLNKNIPLEENNIEESQKGNV